MTLAIILKHRIQIRLRRYGRPVGERNFSASQARHSAVIDKGPWALRKIGDRAGRLRATGGGYARLLPASIAAGTVVVVAAFVLSIVGV